MALKETFLQDTYGEVSYFPEKDYIYISLIGDISKENYKRLWQVFAGTTIERNISFGLVDQRPMGKVGLDARSWFMLQMMPKLIRDTKNRALFVGVILTKDISNNAAGQFLIKSVRNFTNVDIYSFTTEQEALTWFEEKKQNLQK